MARIERGQFADFLRRYLGMTGESHIGDELAPEVSPVLVLERERPEWEFLKGAKLMGMTGLITNGVGVGATRIRNPAGSGVVAIFEGWDIGSSGTTGFNLARLQTNIDLPTVIGVVPIPRDTRYPGAGVRLSAMIGSLDNTGAPPYGDIFWSVGAAANTPWRWWGNAVLMPGWALTMFTTATNVSLNGGISWLEKRIDALEQQ